jgi:hypothetical protein
MQIRILVKKIIIHDEVEDEDHEEVHTLVNEQSQLMLQLMVQQHVIVQKQITLMEQIHDVHSNVNLVILGMDKNVLDEVDDEMTMKK